MSDPRHSKSRRRPGSTLVELSVVVVATGILASMAVPSYRRALEQARVDQAAANLRTIWAAQRFHRLDQGEYAPSLAALLDARLISPDLAALEGDGEAESPGPPRFEYWISEATPTAFLAHARRLPASPWSGTLTIDEQGVFDPASTVSDGSHSIAPPLFLRSAP